MKNCLIIFFFICNNTFAMGDPRFFLGVPLSGKEIQHINDIEDTTTGINQFSPDSGHQNQQMLEEKEIKKIKEKEKTKEKAIKNDRPTPIQSPKLN